MVKSLRGHFYFGQIGHYHFGTTALTPRKIARKMRFVAPGIYPYNRPLRETSTRHRLQGGKQIL